MKRSYGLLVVAAMVFSASVSLNADPRTIDSRITAVTVYNDRALVTRTAQLELGEGDHFLYIDQIPLQADESSIRAKLVGPDALLYGLNHSVKMRGFDDTAAQYRLKATIDSLANSVIAPIDDRIAVLESQKAMLERLADNSGSPSSAAAQTAFSVRDWETAYGLVSRHRPQLADSLRLAALKKAEAERQIDALEIEWERTQNRSLEQLRSVRIDLHARVAGKYTVSVSYTVSGATWRSQYGARLSDSGSVELDYFALIQQQTGEDWFDVELTLSTARPDREAAPGETRPKLLSAVELANVGVVAASKDLLRITETANLRQITSENIKNMPVSTVQDLLATQISLVDHFGEGQAQYIGQELVNTSMSTLFKTRRKESIHSGGGWVRTQINQWTFSGKISYLARTQSSTNVFRFVRLKNETNTPLLPGAIALFAESDFVGALKSRLMILPNQEFELAFGIDDRFEVKRETTNRRTIVSGDNRKLEETVVITLINHGTADAAVEVEDAVPVSSDSRIKVKVKSISPEASTTKDQGIRRWQMILSQSQEATIRFSYEVEHPTTLAVVGI